MGARSGLDLAGLALCLAMGCVISAAGLRPGGRRPYLALVFLEAGLYFLSDLVSSQAGLPILALVLSLGSALYGLPSLYLFARAFSGATTPRALIHYVPALANVPIGTVLAISYAGNDFVGGTTAVIHLLAVLLAQTAQLVLYGRAALRLARDACGTTGSSWPRRATVTVIVGYSAFLGLSWVQYGLTLAYDLMGLRKSALAGADILFVLISLLLGWTLGLCVLWERDYRKYGGRPLERRDAEALVERTRALLAAAEELSSDEVQPRGIAAKLGVPYHVFSRAVNETLNRSVSDLINEYRLARAKKLLAERPDLGILEIGLEAGFQAKSTFNEVFRRHVGKSPRQYREALRKENGQPRT